MSQEIKVYKANHEPYEGWGISEVGKSCLDLPEDFEDYEQLFVLKSDHDTEVQALKADLEALVKMYGDKDNWTDKRPSYVPETETLMVVQKYSDFEVLHEKRNTSIGGKLAREIGERNGIKYE